MPTNDELKCCYLEEDLNPCEARAVFEVRGESNHPEDYTHACEDHVGALLGTPDWLHKDNRAWTVLYLGGE